MSLEPAAKAIEQKTDKIPFWVKLGYGGFEGSYAIIWGIFYAYFMYFATDVVGLSPASAGLIMMISALGDAISDPLTGIITDKINTRWGRRRPILLAIALPYGFASWLLFTAPGWGETATVVYFSIMVIIFYTAIDFVWTPGLALGTEMTLDYDERTSLSGYRAAWDFIAGLASMSTCLVVAKAFTERLGSARAGWSAMAALYGFIAIFPILLTWRATRGYERHREESPKLSLKAIWFAIAKNKSFLYVLGIYAFAGASINYLMSVSVYWYTYYFGYEEAQIGIIMAIMALGVVIWVPFFSWLGQKLDKKNAIIITYLFATIALVGLWFVKPLGGNAEMWQIVSLLLIAGCVGPGIFLLTVAMISDTVEVDELKTGDRREGLYFSIASFVQKLSISIVLWSTGFVLEKVGYIAGAEQSASAITGIRVLVSWAPAALVAISLVFVFINPMTREKHAALVRAIELKKAGKEYNIEPIKDLL